VLGAIAAIQRLSVSLLMNTGPDGTGIRQQLWLTQSKKHCLLAKQAHHRKTMMRFFVLAKVLAKVLPYPRQVRSLIKTFNTHILCHP
jgi:hypothetical protein